MYSLALGWLREISGSPLFSRADIAQQISRTLAKAPMENPPQVYELMAAKGSQGFVEVGADASVADAVSRMQQAKVRRPCASGGVPAEPQLLPLPTVAFAAALRAHEFGLSRTHARSNVLTPAPHRCTGGIAGRRV